METKPKKMFLAALSIGVIFLAGFATQLGSANAQPTSTDSSINIAYDKTIHRYGVPL